MAVYLTNDTELKSIADAIRTKGSTTDALIFPDGFNEAIANIQTGSGKDTLMERLKGNAVELVDDEITFIPSYSMEESKVVKWDMPALTATWNYSFSYADLTELYEVDSSKWVTIGQSCFGHDTIKFVTENSFTNSGLTIQNAAFQYVKFEDKNGNDLGKIILSPGRLTQSVFVNVTGISKMWISQTTTVSGTNVSQALILNSSVTDIYTDATEKPSRWGDYFSYVNSSTNATVHYGVSLEEFKAL